jgi:hypothetical protein
MKMFKKQEEETVDWFTIAEREKERINEGLTSRKVGPRDVLSVTWNPDMKAYVVWFVKNK